MPLLRDVPVERILALAVCRADGDALSRLREQHLHVVALPLPLGCAQSALSISTVITIAVVIDAVVIEGIRFTRRQSVAMVEWDRGERGMRRGVGRSSSSRGSG